MYTLYILKCFDDSLYTGITNNLENRLQIHTEGKGSKYVRSRLPFRLVYTEEFPDRSMATQRESKIKSWGRVKKIEELDLKV